MQTFIRSWLPTNEFREPTHTLWIYDAGDVQGFLLEDSHGRKDFTVYKYQSREYNQDGCIQETGTIEHSVPKDYFSIESYPCCITPGEPSLLSLPQWKILTTLSSQNASDSPVQTSSCPPLAQPQQPRRPFQQPRRPLQQQQQQPSSLRHSKHQSPALPEHLKSHSSKPVPSQPNERNRRNTLPIRTSSPSSGQVSPAQQPGPTPRKPVSHHQRPSSRRQTAPLKPSSSLPLSPPKPPSSQPPQEPF